MKVSTNCGPRADADSDACFREHSVALLCVPTVKNERGKKCVVLVCEVCYDIFANGPNSGFWTYERISDSEAVFWMAHGT